MRFHASRIAQIAGVAQRKHRAPWPGPGQSRSLPCARVGTGAWGAIAACGGARDGHCGAMSRRVPFIPPILARPNSRLAVAFMLTATAFIAATTLLAKALGSGVLGPPLHAFQVSHGRFLFASIGIGLVALVMRPRVQRPALGLHAGRTLFGWAGVTLMFAAAAAMPLADATAISFLNPVFAMVLAIVFLGEKVGPWRWLAAAITLAGAVILLRPTPAAFQPVALIPLAAALAMGAEVICMKRLAGREPPFQIMLINNAMGLTLASCAVIWVWTPPTPAQWGGLVAIGLIMATAQAFFINAMARAEASFVVPFSYATLIFAALYDGAIFGQWPDAVSLLGAAVILSGAGLLAWREALRAAPQPANPADPG